MKNWFTSDWHLFGTNFLKNEKRMHFKSVEEMNETILGNLFSKVKAGDNLYFLGDIGWKFPEGYIDDLFNKIKKHKINFFWIEGNHDKEKSTSSSIKWRGQIKDIIIQHQPITLCHYPLIVWNKSHYDAISLHGHIHFKDSTWNKWMELPDTTTQDILGHRYNVNTELHGFMPVSFEELMEAKNTLDFHNFDYIERAVFE